MKLERFENELLDCKIGAYISTDNEIYFRGKDVANFLSYGNTTQAININVDDDDKWKLEEICNLSDRRLTSNEKILFI